MENVLQVERTFPRTIPTHVWHEISPVWGYVTDRDDVQKVVNIFSRATGQTFVIYHRASSYGTRDIGDFSKCILRFYEINRTEGGKKREQQPQNTGQNPDPQSSDGDSNRIINTDLNQSWSVNKNTTKEKEKDLLPIIPPDGTPFIIMSSHHYICRYGPDKNRNRNTCLRARWENEKNAGISGGRRRVRRSIKAGCPARIIIRETIHFPDFKITKPNPSKSDRERITRQIRQSYRLGGKERTSRRFYIHLAYPDAHKGIHLEFKKRKNLKRELQLSSREEELDQWIATKRQCTRDPAPQLGHVDLSNLPVITEEQLASATIVDHSPGLSANGVGSLISDRQWPAEWMNYTQGTSSVSVDNRHISQQSSLLQSLIDGAVAKEVQNLSKTGLEANIQRQVSMSLNREIKDLVAKTVKSEVKKHLDKGNNGGEDQEAVLTFVEDFPNILESSSYGVILPLGVRLHEPIGVALDKMLRNIQGHVITNHAGEANQQVFAQIITETLVSFMKRSIPK